MYHASLLVWTGDRTRIDHLSDREGDLAPDGRAGHYRHEQSAILGVWTGAACHAVRARGLFRRVGHDARVVGRERQDGTRLFRFVYSGGQGRHAGLMH